MHPQADDFIRKMMTTLDEVSVSAGRLAGRVETLLWAQAELQSDIERLKATDRFADTRGLENFLLRVQDSLRAVQDGSGGWDGLVRSDVGGVTVETVAGNPIPTQEVPD